MFRHQGKSRTPRHNLQIAVVLSFVAGMVNVTGFLSLQQLTTNVTGHFAQLINEVARMDFWKGMIYFLYIMSFFLGSFSAGFLIELLRESKKLNVYVIPITLEFLILFILALLGNIYQKDFPNVIACSLLFAMGLQNSYVTTISRAVVRTTHLTGLFTDLGIELAQLGFTSKREALGNTIRLRIYIISFFFAGGFLGGFFYSRVHLGFRTLFLAAFILLASLFYDDLKYRWIKAKRRRI